MKKEDLIAHIQNTTVNEEEVIEVTSNYPIKEVFTLVFSLLSMNTLIDYYMNPPFPDFDKFTRNELKTRKKDDFNLVCNCQLSEEFMKDFQENLNWKVISIRQHLSEKFIDEFILSKT